ncbi:MAG: hypothetical protein HY067_10485 [Betaproteobacteria bacterium]|nr:hypothetical protein [Betaproteobacteria bacterium]
MDVLPVAMKKTLYQILGVDSKASVQDIEAAYSRRLEELKVATIQDPNKLVVLQQSKAVLSDPIQRAAYDGSLSGRDAPAPPAAKDEPESSFLQQWGKWIAAGVMLIGVGVWWAKHSATPPPQNLPAKQIASRPVEPAPLPVQPASEPAASAAPNNVAPPAASIPPPADLPANPLLGEWSCSDAISGRNSKYNFQQDGALSIASSDGQITDLKYELSGKDLKLTDPKQVSTLAIEELVAGKMILYAGAGGQRVVCKR